MVCVCIYIAPRSDWGDADFWCLKMYFYMELEHAGTWLTSHQNAYCMHYFEKYF